MSSREESIDLKMLDIGLVRVDDPEGMESFFCHLVHGECQGRKLEFIRLARCYQLKVH